MKIRERALNTMYDSTDNGRRSRRRVVAVLLAATAMTAAACSSNSSSPSASTKASSGVAKAGLASADAAIQKWSAVPTSIPQTAALPSAPPTGKSVVFISNGIPATEQEAQGVQAAATAAGWNFSTVSFNSTNPATLTSALQTALTKKPTAVITIGTPPDQLPASITQAYASAGVPIVAGSTVPVTPSKYIWGPADGPPQFTLTGGIIANWFVANSKGKGQVLFVNVPTFPILQPELTGFQSTVKKNCPACRVTVLNATLSEVDAGAVPATVATTLKAHPGIGYVVFDLGNFADGITSALSAAGLSNVKVAGDFMDQQGAAGLRAGTESAWVGSSYVYVGYEFMDVVFRHVEGVTTGFSADQLGPAQLLTKANIGTTSVWKEPTNALSLFEKIWHVTGS